MRILSFMVLVACVWTAVAGAQPVAPKEPARYASPERASRVQARPPGLRLGLRGPREFALEPLSGSERARLAEPDTRRKTGIHRSLPADALSHGAWETLEDGSRVWRMAIRSPGSDGIRVEFRDFSVGDGKVWLHDGERTAGPYTGRGIFDNGEFWSATIFSEAVTLEYVPSPDSGDGDRLPFGIGAISHQARPVPRAFDATDAGGKDTADYCHLDPNCYPDWQPAMSTVAQLTFEDNGSHYVCSGSLVATRDNSFKPYLLTAGHCIDNEAAARTLEVYWTYQTPGCGAAPPANKDASAKSTVGAHLLASGSIPEGDYSLVLLKDVPNGVTFSGWDVGDPPIGAPLVGLHHPTGSWKRISFGARMNDLTARIGDVVAPASRYLDVLWEKGRTEPGSSGSPLFSSPGVVVGTLTYGAVSPVLSVCQIEPGIAGYARFSNTYANIKDYLENVPAAEVLPDDANLNFKVVNHAAPGAQTITLSTQAAGQVGFKLRADAPWISVSVASGAVSPGKPAQVSLTVDPALLGAPDRYSGTVTILSGAAPPQFINVTAISTVDRSNVAASISPNPVYSSGGQWSFRVRLAETAGAPTRITALKVNGEDYSQQVANWFGTDRIAANGALEASLRAAGLTPGDQYFEFWGLDEGSGEQWYRVASVTLR